MKKLLHNLFILVFFLTGVTIISGITTNDFDSGLEDSNQIKFPGDVVTNINSTGYVIRVVNSTYHNPAVLVAWNTTNYEASWVNAHNITLIQRSESANFTGNDFRCKESFSDDAEYLVYVESTMTIGMSVRLTETKNNLWKGDLLVNLGPDEIAVDCTRLWNHRIKKMFLVDNLTNYEIMGVTNYPGVYEFLDENGDLIGSYQYPVVRQLSSSIAMKRVLVGRDVLVNVILECGNGRNLNVGVGHYIKSATTSYSNVKSSLRLANEYNVSSLWNSNEAGHYYVEFRIMDDQDYKVYTGKWLTVLAPVSHQTEVLGQVSDNRLMYTSSLATGRVSLTNGTNGMIAFFFHNTSGLARSDVTTNALQSFHFTFDYRGLHQVLSLAWNRLSIELIEVSVLVAKVFAIHNLTLASDDYVQTDQDFTLILTALNGSGSTCLIDYNDGTNETFNGNFTKLLNTFTNETNQDLAVKTDTGLQSNFTKAYTTPGNYFMQATCTDGASQTSYIKKIVVQKPVLGLAVQTLPAFAFADPIPVVWNMSDGTNVTVEIFYNAIPCCTSQILTDQGGACLCLVNNGSLFDPDGVVDIKAVAWNRVSNGTDVIEVEVLQVVIVTDLTMVTTTSDFGSGVPGFGTNRDKFPAEYPVRFKVNYTGGPITSITWSMSCNHSNTISNTSVPCVRNNSFSNMTSCGGENSDKKIQFDYSFSEVKNQLCLIKVTLKNSVSESESTTLKAKLDLSVLYQSISNNGPVPVNDSVNIIIEFERLGRDTCIAIDLADNSSLLVYGTGLSCLTRFNVAEINPKINEDPPMVFTSKDEFMQSIVIQHTYHVIASYNVRIIGSNDVSMVTPDVTQVVVLPRRCEYPNVTIQGISQDTNKTGNISQHYRSLALTLTTENEIVCELTQSTLSHWTVYKIDQDPRTSTEPLQSLQKTKYQFHNNIDFSSAELVIPERNLVYGFYAVKVRVQMDGYPDVYGEDTQYVHIVQTPWLEPALTTGALYQVIYLYQATLNASATVDPDFDSHNGITFEWFCKEINDTTPFHLTNESVIYVPQANDTVQPPDKHSVGCFGTGRGRLDKTGIILKLDTKFMIEGKYYGMTLLTSTHHPEFGVRRFTTDIYFHVAMGLPPVLECSCIKNCLPKADPLDKLIIASTCSDLCYGELAFSWHLFWYNNIDTPEPFNLTTLNEVPTETLKNMVTNPINELGMAFKPNSLVVGRKYLLQLTARRPNAVFGELRYTIIMNTAPVNGTCSISPTNGTALLTNFNISCANWIDIDQPLSYEYAYQIKGIETLFFNGRPPPGKTMTLHSMLPIGDTNNDNQLIIKLKIKDNYGSSTTNTFTIKVAPPGKEDIDLAYLIKLVSTNQLDESIQAGDSQAAMRLAAVIASVLNNMAQDDISGNLTASERAKQESDKRAIDELRQTILKSLCSIEVKDMATVLQMGGTLKLLTENTQDLSSESQDLAMSALNSAINSLIKLSKGQSAFQSIQSAVSTLAGTVAQIIIAATQAKENTTIGEDSIARAKQAIFMLDKLHEVILRYMVANEGPSTTSTEHVTLQSEKVSIKNLGQTANEATSCGFKVPDASVFGLGEIVRDVNATISQLDSVKIKMGVFQSNPYTWSSTSKTVSSNVASLDLNFNYNTTSSDLEQEIAITVARDLSQFPEPSTFYMKPDKIEANEEGKVEKYLKHHCFNRTSNWTAMNFELFPEDVGLNVTVYLKTGGKPDPASGDYNLKFELPDFSSCDVETASSGSQGNQSIENETIVIDPYKHCSIYPYSLFISNVDFNQTGQHCFAIQVYNNITTDDPTSSSSRRKRSFSCDIGKRRMRRSCVIIPPPPPTPPPQSPLKVLVADNLGFDGKYFFPNQTPNYNLSMFESSCLYWDEENQTWAGHGCRVGPLTSRDSIQCFCNHLTSFASDLVVAPNPIDFSSVFSNFGSLQDNVAVLALISTVLGLYIIGVLWARRADKRDLLMLGPTILPNPQGSYHYIVTLYTGNRQQSGTSAKVFFKMSGDQDETIPVKLWDRQRPCFERGQENAFLVSYPNAVGELTYVQIWHNNGGSSPSWYLSRLSIKDLQTDQQWYFVCDNWLAVESEDGKVCRVLPVANDQELTSFNQLFTARTLKGLADGHLWFSIFSRPPNSNFTRVQRLSCCLCLLCCTMITSAMFYNMGGDGPSPFAIHIGSLVIDLKQFVIGLESSIIIIPVNVALVQIFRNLRPKESKEDKEKEKEANSIEEIENTNTRQETKDGDKKTEEEKSSKGKLPHWFLYIAYALCYLTSAACIFFTLLYSIQWGVTKSTEWVIAMVTAFLQSVILLQPVKVVVMAVVFAVLIRKPCDSDEDKSQVIAYEPPPETTKKKRRKKSTTVKIYSPPDPKTLIPARIKRLKEIQMNAILKEIAAFFLFLLMLLNVAYYHRNPNTYLMTKTLFETFDEVDAYGVDLAAIYDGDSLWMWARETLVPGLYATEWYNGKKIEKGYIANMEDYLVGVPRIRLLRIEEDSCAVGKYFKDTIPHCYSSYSLINEEKRTFDVAWQPLVSGSARKRRDVQKPGTEKEWLELMGGGSQTKINVRQKRALDPITPASSGKNRRKKKRLLSSEKPKTYTINDQALLPNGKVQSCLERWRHQTTLDLRGFPYWGSIALYSGSGYVANLGYDPVTAYTVISDLHSNGWIDVQTRAVFVEFTVYNANTNLFGIVSLFVEFPSSSAAVTRAQYQAARFYLHLTFGQTLSHVMVIFFMIYFLFREGKLVYKQRCAYFKGFWNWVETILVLSEFATIILFLARLYEVDRNLLQLRENPNDYVGFQYAGSADAALCTVLGVLVFFYTLRFLRLLRFNKNFLVIGKTLARISSPVLSFCLPFFMGFMAFGMFAFTIFGAELEDYSTFTMTMVTQFSMTLGDFDFEALVMVNPLLGALYFFGFVGMNVFILMNMFLAIINDSYAEVQDEEKDVENEYEVLDYVVGKLQTTFKKKSAKKSKVAPKKVKINHKEKPHYVSFKESNEKALLSFKENCLLELESCEKRLDNLLNVIEEGEKSELMNEDTLGAMPEDKQNDCCFRIILALESVPFEIIDDDNMEEKFD